MLSTLLLAPLLLAAPASLDLTGPYRNTSADDIMLALYPGWNPLTHRLAAERTTRDRGRPHTVESAELWEADVWREQEEKEHLLVLVSTWKALPPEEGPFAEDRDPRHTTVQEGLFCDLALLDLEGGKLVVKARLPDAVRCGGGVNATLELKPRPASNHPPFGVRLERSAGRTPDVTLQPFGLEHGALHPLRALTLETTVLAAWKRLEGRLTRGQVVQLAASTAQVSRQGLTDRRPLKDAPLGALLCRIAGSRNVQVGPWPAGSGEHAQLTLTVKADRDGPLECRLNDEAPPEGAWLEVRGE